MQPVKIFQMSKFSNVWSFIRKFSQIHIFDVWTNGLRVMAETCLQIRYSGFCNRERINSFEQVGNVTKSFIVFTHFCKTSLKLNFFLFTKNLHNGKFSGTHFSIMRRFYKHFLNAFQKSAGRFKVYKYIFKYSRLAQKVLWRFRLLLLRYFNDAKAQRKKH